MTIPRKTVAILFYKIPCYGSVFARPSTNATIRVAFLVSNYDCPIAFFLQHYDNCN